jgi:hypothetical protein
VDDGVRRWAAQRAPDLLARAEAEAIVMLRDALVDAALGDRAPLPTPAREPQPPANPEPPAEEGELLWAYCVLASGDGRPADLTGVDPRFELEWIESGDLAALVSRVPRAEFSAERLRANLNDLVWLERVARSHEGVLETALVEATIVPLRLCTIFEDAGGVRRMLEQERSTLTDALSALVGREEWGVKLLVDPDRLEHAAHASSSEAAALTAELEKQTGGGAYMLRRRLERHVREQADALAAECAADVRRQLAGSVIDVVTRPPQNRELSGHEGAMLVNAACLVDVQRVQRLRALAAELEESHADLGARVELTGPWPPYNFVPGGDAAVLA